MPVTAPATDASIGVFDSGVGGLTVARAILDQLPHEEVLYVGDTAHSPYGPKPIAQVRAYALEVLDRLVEDGVKALVIACNTASSAVLRDARERYEAASGIPVIEVVHPAVRAAVRTTRNGRVGVIGTVGTIASRAYEDAFAAASGMRLVTAACPRFVEFVEAGITTGDELLAVAERYLAPVRDEGVDTLVLGCTHYPLLAGAIRYVMGPEVALVSSAEETAADLYRVLVTRGLERRSAARPVHRFEATGADEAGFRALAARFLVPELTRVEPFPTGPLHLRPAAVHPTPSRGAP
ncbi:MAG: glutamate racemase [Micrococcales bacterium]|nr:glutamate racemase [Micrococcales bacterium]